MSFENKVAIITGGGQGIGAAFARLLVAQGAKVALADINVEKANELAAEINGADGTAIVVQTDVSATESCNACAAQVVEAFGGIDYLVNNAGMMMAANASDPAARSQPLHLIDEVYYHRILAVNMHSMLFMTRAVLESMKARGGGAIVNMSSLSSWQSSGAYSISKLGVNGITISLAHELAAFGIRVNAIAPGPIYTDGMKLIQSIESLSQWALSRGHPTGEIPGPELIAEAGIFLLSDKGGLINGQIVPVDGGISIRP